MNLSKTSFYIIKQTDKSTEKRFFFLVIKSVKKIILKHLPNEKKKWFEALTSFNNLPKWKIKRWFRFGENEVTKILDFWWISQKRHFTSLNKLTNRQNFFFFLVIKSVKKIILQHLPNGKKKWFEGLTLLNNLPKWKIKRWFRFGENKVTKNLDFWWISQKRHFTSLNKLTNRQKRDFFFLVIKSVKKIILQHLPNEKKKVIWSFNIIQQSVKMKNQKVISVWRK